MDIFQKLYEIENETGGDVSGIKKLIEDGQVTIASSMPSPDPKDSVREIELINSFMTKYPPGKADGGRIGGGNIEGEQIGNRTGFSRPEIGLNKNQQKLFDKIKRKNIFPGVSDYQKKTNIRSGRYTNKLVNDYIKVNDLVKKENLIDLTEMGKLLNIEEKTRDIGGPTAGFRASIIDALTREEDRLSPSKRKFLNEYLIKKMKLSKYAIGSGQPTYLIISHSFICKVFFHKVILW